MKNIKLIAATLCAGAFAAIMAVAPGIADADPTEPPPLSEQPAQYVEDHHISPGSCKLVTPSSTGVEQCQTPGERWRCPVGLSPTAIHRGPLTYNETISPEPPATRWSHCLFVGTEAAYPLPAVDPDRPVIECVEEFVVTGIIVKELCQTTGDVPAVPAPTATPVPNPQPMPNPCNDNETVSVRAGVTICTPNAPTVAFTG